MEVELERRASPLRTNSVHEIEFDIEGSNAPRNEKKYFYAGTVSGWFDKHQTAVTTVGAVVAILLISLTITTIYIRANGSDDEFDDEDCWPFSCPSSFMTDLTSGIDDDFYWEHGGDTPSSPSIWAFRLPSPTNRNLYKITYFESESLDYHYVAVGDDCTILVSNNGTNWQLLPPIVPHIDLISISYSEETFYVETTTGDCYSSEDLFEWLPSEHSFSSGIASSEDTSIGVEHNTVWRRDLSLNWIRVIIRDADAILDVTHGNGNFVLIGTTHMESQPDAQYACIWISETGVTWEQYFISQNILRNAEQLQIALAGTFEGRGIFLAFADQLYTSGTATNWLPVTQTPWLERAAPTSLNCATSGHCVALSESGGLTVVSQTSDYGISWHSKIVGTTFYDICDNNQNVFTGVGTRGSVIQGITDPSVDSIHWDQVAPKFGDEISSLIFAEGRFVASSEEYSTYFSTNGIQWEQHDSPSLSFLAHGGGTYVGIFSNSLSLDVYNSPSASNWTVAESFDGYYEISKLIFDGHQFVLTGRTCDECTQFDDDDDDTDDHYINVLYTSRDGREWTIQNTTGINSFLIDFAWNSVQDCYLGVGFDGSLYTTDELSNTWSELYIQEDLECVSVAVNQQNGLAMAIFSTKVSEASFIAKSADCGSSWNIVECTCDGNNCGPVNTIAYVYLENQFYLGGSEILRTTDGSEISRTSTEPVSLDSMDTLCIGNNALLVLSEKAILSASFDTISFTPTANCK